MYMIYQSDDLLKEIISASVSKIQIKALYSLLGKYRIGNSFTGTTVPIFIFQPLTMKEVEPHCVKL